MNDCPDGEPVETVAMVVHETMRAFASRYGDHMPSWEEAPDWMREATYEGVRFRLSHREASSGAQHDQWMAQKAGNGWRYGEVKDADARTHPMMVPFEDLPVHERRKDALFAAVVEALTRPV